MNKVSRRKLARYAVDQLQDGAKPQKVWQSLAAVLIISKRLNEVELLADDIAWELEARGEFASARLTTAHKLSNNLSKEWTTLIKRAAAVNRVKLREIVDPEVLGGLKIETAIHSWDETLERRLNELKGIASA